MKKLKKLLTAIRKTGGVIIEQGEDGFACQIPRAAGAFSYSMAIIASWGEEWDNVSIHNIMQDREETKDFTPVWGDMCYVKNLFFKASETVLQYHPPSNIYINNHEHTLHLWRPQNKEIELPPIGMV